MFRQVNFTDKEVVVPRVFFVDDIKVKHRNFYKDDFFLVYLRPFCRVQISTKTMLFYHHHFHFLTFPFLPSFGSIPPFYSSGVMSREKMSYWFRIE